MTLFAHATPDNQVFLDAMRQYFGGEFDRLASYYWNPLKAKSGLRFALTAGRGAA